MSKTVNLKIDGREVKVPEGMNLLDAALEAGIHIPNLCYLKGMKGIGACRLCLVQLEGGKGPVTACTTKVKDGMVVITDTEELREMRRFVLDLIISMHPLDCMTCTKAGVCTLQRYAYDSEIKESTFTRKNFGYPVDSGNPFIKRDPDYCILCGRCVRVCREQGTNVLDFMGRGVGSKVTTANDRPLQESGCTFCGSCVDVCPVNAILEADRWRKGREWEYERKDSVCLLCGDACDIVVSIKDNMIMKINIGDDDSSVKRYICATGRFGFDAVTSDLRINIPLKRVDGRLQETTWDDAIKTASQRFLEAGGDTAILVSAGLLNEDLATLLTLSESVIKTDNIASTVSLYADHDSIRKSDSVDIDTADLIMLVGVNPSQWKRILPALDASIRRRIARGARLVVINSKETGLGDVATITIRGDETYTLSQVARSLISKGAKADVAMREALSNIPTTEECEKVAELINESTSSVIFTSPSLFNASRNLSLLSRLQVVAVTYEANARGVVLSGIDRRDFVDIITGKNRVVYAIGELPIRERPLSDFLIVQASYMTELAKQADLILPSVTFYESAGTIVSYYGDVKKISKTVRHTSTARQHRDIFKAVSEQMGKTIKDAKVDVKRLLKQKGKSVFMPFEKQKGFEFNPDEFIEAISKPITEGSRLQWLVEEADTVEV